MTQEIYKCGLRANQLLRLRRDLQVTDTDGKLVHVHPAGERWEVLPPRPADPVVFLLQPDGNMHTWDDDDEIYDWLEVIGEGCVLTPRRPVVNVRKAIGAPASADEFEIKAREALPEFIEKLPPVAWVYWETETHDEQARSDLHSVLFDETEHLRDLTDPTVAKEVSRCVLRHPELQRAALQMLTDTWLKINEQTKP